MDWISPTRFAHISDVLFEMHEAVNIGEVISRLATHIPSLVPVGSVAAFHVGDDGMQFTKIVSPDLDPSLFTAYTQYYEPFDIYKEIVLSQSPVPTVDRSSDYMDYKEWERSEHRSDFLIPNGLYHLAGIQIIVEGRTAADFCLHREESAPDFSDEEMSLLRTLQHHASLACHNSLSYTKATGAMDTLASVHQGSKQAVIIFDGRLRPEYRNTAAALIVEQYRGYAGHGVSLVSVLADLIAHYRGAGSQEQIKTPCHAGRLRLKQRVLEYRIITASSSLVERRYVVYLQWADTIGEAQQFPFGLSRREYEIAQLVARGTSNSQIAETLNISHNTVKTHIKHMLEKTGSHTRTEFVYLLLRKHPQMEFPSADDTPANHAEGRSDG